MKPTNRIFLIISLVLFLGSGHVSAQNAKPDARAVKLESKADRSFIKGDYLKAMKIYKQAEARLADNNPQKYTLAVKMARLYVLLQMPDEIIYYYDMVHSATDTLLTVNDICFYVDALRQKEEMRRAEIVVRQYAFKNQFSRNQRFLNLLHSIETQRYYYKKGEADFGVELVQSGPLAEYWLGEWSSTPFYAASSSRIQDPLKIFYHQTKYYTFDGDASMDKLRAIPLELHSGPVAFTQDESMMVATGISYRESDRITELGSDQGVFITQLYYSVIDQGNRRWSRFEPLFEYQEGNNYAHPTFFNNDRSIVFSSDRPGGYGGMDLYISNWDDETMSWSEPENMGPRVNTEGDEIYPRVIGDALYFSSNGLEGYGGYDIYRVSFGNGIVLPGSIFHFPYPINTVFNDFGIFYDSQDNGYFISDRAGMGTKDDIYTFDATWSALSSGNIVGVSDEYSAMLGNLNLITGLMSNQTETFQKEYEITPQYQMPQEGELLVTVYFDFNKYSLTRESVQKLNDLMADGVLDYVTELHLIGYADDIGRPAYNMQLSKRRAQSVENYLRNNGGAGLPELYVEGRGQISLTPEELKTELEETLPYLGPTNFESSNVTSRLSFEERIKINRTLRRVDIVVSKR